MSPTEEWKASNMDAWRRLKVATLNVFRCAEFDDADFRVRIDMHMVMFEICCDAHSVDPSTHIYRVWAWFPCDRKERLRPDDEQDPYSALRAIHAEVHETLRKTAYAYTGGSITNLVPLIVRNHERLPVWGLTADEAYRHAALLLGMDEREVKTLGDENLARRLEGTDEHVQKFFSGRHVRSKLSTARRR